MRSANGFQNALVIVNPVSGQARGARMGKRVQAGLLARGVACSLRTTAGPGEATAWARSAAVEGFDLIVGVGGDGTIQEIVAGQARAPQKVPVAIAPVGTANVVAIALSLPWLAGPVVDTMLTGEVVPFDVGYLPVHDRFFFLMAAIGFPARLIEDSPRRLKNLFGAFTYVAAGIRAALRPDHARISITFSAEQTAPPPGSPVPDSVEQTRRFVANTVLVTNIGRIGDINLKVTPDTSPHDGIFDISVISSRTLWDVLKIVFRMLTWRRRTTPRLQHITAARVEIQAEPAVPVQIDGEALGTTPVVAEVVKSGVEMIVGKRYRRH